jgi:hypothetical protein
MSLNHQPWARAVGVATGLATLATVGAAWACGGLFCSVPQGPTPPEPVDQSAERIIFDIDEDAGKTTAHVQITYVGDPAAFAWIVPVPGVPDVADSKQSHFEELDAATRLMVTPPPSIPCAQRAFADDSSAECGGCSDSDVVNSAGGDEFGDNPNPDSPVTVYAHDFTDNYEYHVIGAERTGDLVTWLQDNLYNVTDNMTPVMDVYNNPALRFLAVKLIAGKDAADVVPLAFTYDGTEPVIPIRLTAVAAQPLMGIQVFIRASQPYAPANFDLVHPDTTEMVLDANYAPNYFAWVARQADERDGKLFVAEYIGADPGTAGLPPRGTLSRYYTRMSGHHMNLDPKFSPAPNASAPPRTLDFSARDAIYDCGTPIAEALPGPCAFHYCGTGATCFASAGRAHCACPEGAVAQSFRGPGGDLTSTCVPRSNPVGVTDESAAVGTEFDPCLGVVCGEGACVVRGGFVACECEEGAAAMAGETTCATLGDDAEAFGPGAGPEAVPGPTAARTRRVRSRSKQLAGLAFPVLLLLLAQVALRRRWFV